MATLRTAKPPRLLARELFPNGIVWVDLLGLPMAAAFKGDEVPFAFAVGRVASASGEVAASELDVVAEAICAAEPTTDLGHAISQYALYVVGHCPSVMARLRGEVATAFVATLHTGGGD
jgi:hypothetical protein